MVGGRRTWCPTTCGCSAAPGSSPAGRSSHDARDTYYHLDLDRCARSCWPTPAPALHPALRPWPGPQPATAVADGADPHSRAVRVHRQQRPLTGRRGPAPSPGSATRVEVTSAGSAPEGAHGSTRARSGSCAARLRHRHRRAQRPRGTSTTLAGRRFDHVVTLCDRVREVCTRTSPGQPRPTCTGASPTRQPAGDGPDAGRSTPRCSVPRRTSTPASGTCCTPWPRPPATTPRPAKGPLRGRTAPWPPRRPSPASATSSTTSSAAVDFYTAHLGFTLRQQPGVRLRRRRTRPAAAAAVRRRELRRPGHARTTTPPPAATASISPSRTSTPRSDACAPTACPASAATSSPAPAVGRSCSADPAGNLVELFEPAGSR